MNFLAFFFWYTNLFPNSFFAVFSPRSPFSSSSVFRFFNLFRTSSRMRESKSFPPVLYKKIEQYFFKKEEDLKTDSPLCALTLVPISLPERNILGVDQFELQHPPGAPPSPLPAFELLKIKVLPPHRGHKAVQIPNLLVLQGPRGQSFTPPPPPPTPHTHTPTAGQP